VYPTTPSPAAKVVGYSLGTRKARKSVQEVLNEKKLLKYLNFSPIVTILSSETNKSVKDEESIY
jgi:hypothetical protein